jgi:hypothetical protein
MLSSVYQLATTDRSEYVDIDPENRFFWRFNRQRLEAEQIRDALLQVSGELDTKIGGESLQLDDEKNNRRTVYGEVSRFQVHEYLQTFDFPNPSLTAERRFSTNVPLQSLYFMNSDFVHRQSQAFVMRLATMTTTGEAGADSIPSATSIGAGGNPPTTSTANGGTSGAGGVTSEGADSTRTKVIVLPEGHEDRAMIAAAYPLLYGREVTEAETKLGLDFLAAQREALFSTEMDAIAKETAEADGTEALARQRAAAKAWVQYARALFSAAEFRFID